MKEENGNDKKRRKKLVNFLDSLLKHLRALTISTYYQAIEELRADIESGADFTWDNNGTAEKKIIDLFKILEGNINLLLANGVSNWYQEGLTAAEEQVINELKGKGIIKHNRDVKLLKEQATAERRMEAVAGHAQTVTYRNGALNNLSNRVWDFKNNAKKEIEFIIQEAIKAGKGVNETKNSVKEFLNTDGNGKMKHSGAGVYNTNLKNCERLMRTEINAAYRSAEIDSYQGMDVVLGFRINISGNHYTKNGNKPPKPLHDICDECAGDYPKNFVWFGWHPNCRCYITPITMSPAQFAAYMEADDQGKGEEYLETIRVKDFPDGFKNYFASHAGEFTTKPPQWLRNNPQLKLPAAPTFRMLPTTPMPPKFDNNYILNVISKFETNIKTVTEYKKVY